MKNTYNFKIFYFILWALVPVRGPEAGNHCANSLEDNIKTTAWNQKSAEEGRTCVNLHKYSLTKCAYMVTEQISNIFKSLDSIYLFSLIKDILKVKAGYRGKDKNLTCLRTVSF